VLFLLYSVGAVSESFPETGKNHGKTFMPTESVNDLVILFLIFPSSLFSTFLFRRFVQMACSIVHIEDRPIIRPLVLDMSDCYTWSFPEFVPFCPHLFYFSSFKAFKTFTQA
jgi:hypothetical protein